MLAALCPHANLVNIHCDIRPLGSRDTLYLAVSAESAIPTLAPTQLSFLLLLALFRWSEKSIIGSTIILVFKATLGASKCTNHSNAI